MRAKKIRCHIFLWAGMLLFLFIAPLIKDRFTIVNGLPVEMNITLPAATEAIQIRVEKLGPYKRDGQYFHLASGYTFLDGSLPQDNYEKFLIFRNDNRIYYFSTNSYPRKDVQPAFPEVESDLSQSGFHAYIAKEKMPNGIYEVGVLYRNLATGELAYRSSNQNIQKTYNQLFLRGD